MYLLAVAKREDICMGLCMNHTPGVSRKICPRRVLSLTSDIFDRPTMSVSLPCFSVLIQNAPGLPEHSIHFQFSFLVSPHHPCKMKTQHLVGSLDLLLSLLCHLPEFFFFTYLKLPSFIFLLFHNCFPIQLRGATHLASHGF